MQSNHNKINDMAYLDPIDGKLLAESWSRSEAKKALLQELTEEPMVVAAARDGDVLATRPPQRTLRLGAIARRTVAIGVAAAVVLGTFLFAVLFIAIQSLRPPGERRGSISVGPRRGGPL